MDKLLFYLFLILLFITSSLLFAFYFKYKNKRDLLLKQTSLVSIKKLDWRSFEILCGEMFRQMGYNSTVVGGVNEADGGIDLVLQKNGEKFLVQCKQWRTTSVNVKVVRETFGLMHAHRAKGCYVITCGGFTKDALLFEKENPSIKLINGDKLWEMIKNIKTENLKLKNDAKFSDNTPMCPKCGAVMIKRKAKNGFNKGGEFWGCTNYPKCKSILNVE